MKIIFLGTNGWYDSETGETPCLLIDAKEAYVICDAGNAFRKLDKYITENKPISLFLSHFHIDHISGLHILDKYSFKQGITILCHTKRILEQFLAKPYTNPLENVRKQMPIKVIDISEGRHKLNGFEFEAKALVHADLCYGFAFYLEGKKVSYCTDTGKCDAVTELGKNADLLITECAWKERNQQPNWPHLAPEDAAEMAKKSNAEMLALTHFNAYLYTSLEDRRIAEAKAKKIFRNTITTTDNLIINI